MSCSQLALCANFLYSTFFKWASDELCYPFFFSYYMTKTMHVSVTLSVLVHMAGVFHVVALSIIRYFSLSALANIHSSQQWFTFQKFRISLTIIFVSVAIIGIPLHFTSEVVMVEENEGCARRHPALRNATAFQLQFSSFPHLQTLNFWLFNLCSKIIPSVILCLMTFMILAKLKRIQQLSSRFTSVERDKQYQRTTKMILIIMFIFIIVELPQGLLAVAATVTELQLIVALENLFRTNNGKGAAGIHSKIIKNVVMIRDMR
nr:7TM GPCR domain containing protein [Haemonchus contortus]